jgi:hypothetical protein
MRDELKHEPKILKHDHTQAFQPGFTGVGIRHNIHIELTGETVNEMSRIAARMASGAIAAWNIGTYLTLDDLTFDKTTGILSADFTLIESQPFPT